MAVIAAEFFSLELLFPLVNPARFKATPTRSDAELWSTNDVELSLTEGASVWLTFDLWSILA